MKILISSALASVLFLGCEQVRPSGEKNDSQAVIAQIENERTEMAVRRANQAKELEDRKARRIEAWNLTQEAKAKRRKDYLAAHPELKIEVKEAILNGEVLIGMTAEQVTAAIGAPKRTEILKNTNGLHEQWVYSSSYLYFDNGVLTSLQQSQ